VLVVQHAPAQLFLAGPVQQVTLFDVDLTVGTKVLFQRNLAVPIEVLFQALEAPLVPPSHLKGPTVDVEVLNVADLVGAVPEVDDHEHLPLREDLPLVILGGHRGVDGQRDVRHGETLRRHLSAPTEVFK